MTVSIPDFIGHRDLLDVVRCLINSTFYSKFQRQLKQIFAPNGEVCIKILVKKEKREKRCIATKLHNKSESELEQSHALTKHIRSFIERVLQPVSVSFAAFRILGQRKFWSRK